MSQEELAQRLNVKAPFLSAIEHSRKPPPNALMAKRIGALLHPNHEDATAFEEDARKARAAWKHWLDLRASAKRPPFVRVGDQPPTSALLVPLNEANDYVLEVRFRTCPRDPEIAERGAQM